MPEIKIETQFRKQKLYPHRKINVVYVDDDVTSDTLNSRRNLGPS